MAELAEAMAQVDNRRNYYNAIQERIEIASHNEEEAWGDRESDEPQDREAWEAASAVLEREGPAAQKAFDALHACEQRIERLSSDTELPLRLDLAAYTYLEG